MAQDKPRVQLTRNRKLAFARPRRAMGGLGDLSQAAAQIVAGTSVGDALPLAPSPTSGDNSASINDANEGY